MQPPQLGCVLKHNGNPAAGEQGAAATLGLKCVETLTH